MYDRLRLQCLPTHVQAVRTMHLPDSLDEAEEARRRLAFDELLCMQLQLLLQRDLSRYIPISPCACTVTLASLPADKGISC